LTQEFFSQGASVEVVLRDDPTAEDDEEKVLEGQVVARDEIGLLIDGGEDYGHAFIPWANISQVLAVEALDLEEGLGPQDNVLS
jgi:hypothetical protein